MRTNILYQTSRGRATAPLTLSLAALLCVLYAMKKYSYFKNFSLPSCRWRGGQPTLPLAICYCVCASVSAYKCVHKCECVRVFK